jgi:hypothetical protein
LAHIVHAEHPLQVLLTSLIAQFKLSRFNSPKPAAS